MFTLPDPVVVDVITAEAFVEFMASGKLDEIAKSGDQAAMLMALQAQAAVVADSDETLQGEESLVPGLPPTVLTPQEEADNKAAVKGQVRKVLNTAFSGKKNFENPSTNKKVVGEFRGIFHSKSLGIYFLIPVSRKRLGNKMLDSFFISVEN